MKLGHLHVKLDFIVALDYGEGGHVTFVRARCCCLSSPDFSPCKVPPLLEHHIARTAERPTETIAAAAPHNIYDISRR